jgi:hypothetical protein
MDKITTLNFSLTNENTNDGGEKLENPDQDDPPYKIKGIICLLL